MQILLHTTHLVLDARTEACAPRRQQSSMATDQPPDLRYQQLIRTLISCSDVGLSSSSGMMMLGTFVHSSTDGLTPGEPSDSPCGISLAALDKTLLENSL